MHSASLDTSEPPPTILTPSEAAPIPRDNRRPASSSGHSVPAQAPPRRPHHHRRSMLGHAPPGRRGVPYHLTMRCCAEAMSSPASRRRLSEVRNRSRRTVGGAAYSAVVSRAVGAKTPWTVECPLRRPQVERRCVASSSMTASQAAGQNGAGARAEQRRYQPHTSRVVVVLTSAPHSPLPGARSMMARHGAWCVLVNFSEHVVFWAPLLYGSQLVWQWPATRTGHTKATNSGLGKYHPRYR